MLATCNPNGRWRDLRAIGMVRAEHTLGGKTSAEERYFILLAIRFDGRFPSPS